MRSAYFVREVFRRIGREDVRDEWRGAIPGTVLRGNIVSEKFFSRSNFIMSESRAAPASTVEDSPGSSFLIEPEARAGASTRHFASISLSLPMVVKYARPILDISRLPLACSAFKVATDILPPKWISQASLRVIGVSSFMGSSR